MVWKNRVCICVGHADGPSSCAESLGRAPGQPPPGRAAQRARVVKEYGRKWRQARMAARQSLRCMYACSLV